MMETQDQEKEIKPRQNGRIIGGLFLLVVGGILLLGKADLLMLPVWLFTWPMILIVIGILSGIKHGFRGGGWFVMILIGSFFLIDRNLPELEVRRFLLPLVVISAGILMLVRPKHFGTCGGRRNRFRRRFGNNWREDTVEGSAPNQGGTSDSFSTLQGEPSKDDILETVSVFGGVRKIVLSKNFRGGEVTSVLGGTEVDFSQADINGRAELEVTSVLGATKLIIPSHWDIKSDVTAVLGAWEDKRKITGVIVDPNKVLVLKGVSFLGGLEITSY